VFGTRDEAMEAGYRPCERCKAELPRADRALENALHFLDRHVEERVTLKSLSAAAGLSPYHLQRTFTRAVGVSPRQYQAKRRLERFKKLVREGDGVGEATYGAGFGSSRALYERAASHLGMTPSVYRRKGEGESIVSTVVKAESGRLLIAVTERGICAVLVGDDERELKEALKKEFPKAAITEDDAALKGMAEKILGQIRGERCPNLPLDLRGTAFELRVWRALKEIPRGKTESYAALAERIGKPLAWRAVARACAKNRVALVVPCHRVVRMNGDPGGYRWGKERKVRILEAERAEEKRAAKLKG
jgi:AraC family transcriptional regulator, regulatory protein of adaptative response / methylated-DNA-[protein]-cysteine methyltransferase